MFKFGCGGGVCSLEGLRCVTGVGCIAFCEVFGLVRLKKISKSHRGTADSVVVIASGPSLILTSLSQPSMFERILILPCRLLRIPWHRASTASRAQLRQGAVYNSMLKRGGGGNRHQCVWAKRTLTLRQNKNAFAPSPSVWADSLDKILLKNEHVSLEPNCTVQW